MTQSDLSEDEKLFLTNHFSSLLVQSKVPGKKECLEAAALKPSIKEKIGGNWNKIKYIIIVRVQKYERNRNFLQSSGAQSKNSQLKNICTTSKANQTYQAEFREK